MIERKSNYTFLLMCSKEKVSKILCAAEKLDSFSLDSTTTPCPLSSLLLCLLWHSWLGLNLNFEYK